MSKYKINIDKPVPTKEEINKFKNFDNLVSDYSKLHSPWILLNHLYHNRKLMRLFIVLVAILIAVFFGTQYNEKETNPPDKVVEEKEAVDLEHQR